MIRRVRAQAEVHAVQECAGNGHIANIFPGSQNWADFEITFEHLVDGVALALSHRHLT